MVLAAAVVLGCTLAIPLCACDSARSPRAAAPPRPATADSSALISSVRRSPAEEARRFAEVATGRMERARTTGDASEYVKAQEAVDAALALDGASYEVQRLVPWILAGEHRFAESAAAARDLLRVRPEDAFVHGLLGDALVETGDYAGAAAAFETMVALRPAAPGYARIAYLRELHGDRTGARAALDLAIRAASGGPHAHAAWYLAQRGDLRLGGGDAAGAAADYGAALARAPELVAARAGIARVRTATRDLGSAAEVWAGLAGRGAPPAHVAAYADVLARIGRTDEAAFQRARLASAAPVDRDLAVLRAERGIDPLGSLTVAEAELRVRGDVYGWDAVAWCAYHAGRIDRALEASRQALRLGTRDARLLYHAGMIALAAGREDLARQQLEAALALQPEFELAGASEARATLARLTPPNRARR